MCSSDLAYMSPESILGDRVDARSDLYSLGCVAYWMLTGRTLFDSQNAIRMMTHHVQTKPLRLSEVSELDIPDELEQIVFQCLEKSSDARPSSADKLWRLLGETGLDQRWTPERAESWWKLHLPIVPHSPNDEAVQWQSV